LASSTNIGTMPFKEGEAGNLPWGVVFPPPAPLPFPKGAQQQFDLF